MLFLKKTDEAIWKPPFLRKLPFKQTPYFWAVFWWPTSLFKFQKGDFPPPLPNYVSQIVNFPTWIPDSVILTVLLFFIHFYLLMLVFVLQWQGFIQAILMSIIQHKKLNLVMSFETQSPYMFFGLCFCFCLITKQIICSSSVSYKQLFDWLSSHM